MFHYIFKTPLLQQRIPPTRLSRIVQTTLTSQPQLPGKQPLKQKVTLVATAMVWETMEAQIIALLVKVLGKLVIKHVLLVKVMEKLKPSLSFVLVVVVMES